MEDGWLLHLRQRLTYLNGSIWVEGAWKPKSQRVGMRLSWMHYPTLPTPES
jgi:hypothetical protein